MFATSFKRALAPCIIVLSLAFVGLSQDLDDVTVSGKVTDANGLAVVGATVTATSVETGLGRSVVTDDEGRYKIVKLKPGTYKIKATQTGFAAVETTEIKTISAQNVEQVFKLSPAGVTAETTITVTDEDGPLIDTARTVVGGTITAREIEEIPNFSRNPLDLVLTLGGTSEEQLSVNGLAEDKGQTSSPPLEQGNYSVSGGVAYSNNLTIDGLDNNDDRSSRDRFQPSMESIAEVQVIQNQFSAEYGRASGGRINLRTRAGSNKFRGRAFMFFRDARMNANSWYNNSRGIARPPLTDYNPGFTFSGPARLPFYNGKNRTFFSVAYEFDDVLDTTLIDSWVPVGSSAKFALPPGGPCPSGVTCTDTRNSTSTAIAPYIRELPTPNRNHILTARVDHKLFTNNDLTAGFQFGRKKNARTTFAGTTTRLDDALQIRNSNTEAYNVTDNHVFGARAVNQVRTQYSIFEPSYATNEALAPVVIVSYRNPLTGSTQSLTAGNSTISIFGDATAFPQSRRETRIQIQDNFTYITGNHTLKFGGDIQRVRSKALGLGDATGTWRFDSMADFLSGKILSFVQNFGTQNDVTNTYWGVFGNDEMRLAPNMTLSYGLRYERETAVTDNNNFGPRLGMAYSPFKDGKGVIRFGAGVFYNRALLRTIGDFIQNSGGNLVQFDTSSIPTPAGDTRRDLIQQEIQKQFPTGFSSPEQIKTLLAAVCPTTTFPATATCTTNTGFINSVSTTGNPLRSVEPGLKIPQSYQANIGFEHQIGKAWVFETNFTWNDTKNLWRDYNGNVPVLPAGFTDWAQYLNGREFILSPSRKYTFFMGPIVPGSPDTSGLHILSAAGATPCTTTTTNCFVNLNTTNASTATPTVFVSGVNASNLTGGPIGIAKAAIAQFRPNPNVAETSVIASIGRAEYRGWVTELRSRFRQLGHGFGASFRINYTLSRTMDDGLNNTANAQINKLFQAEWARSLQDRRHRIGISGTLEVPKWLGSLRFSPLFRYGTSAPFNPGNGGSDRNLDDNSTDRPNFSGNLGDIVWREPGSPIPTTLFSQFTLATIGSAGGNLPRNAGHGPSFFTFDVNVTREFKLSERMKLRPQIEIDNVLNAAVFSYGSAFIDFGTTAAAQTAFLVPTRTFRQRAIRLGVRFDF